MRTHLLFILTAIIAIAPFSLLAQEQPTTLVQLPISNQGSFDEYINLLYKLSISVAALLAVVKIIIAGVKYMLSDVVTDKSSAIKDIKGALFGLLLIIGAVIVLNTINPALTDGGLKMEKLERLNLKHSQTAPVQATPSVGGGGSSTTPSVGGGQTQNPIASVEANCQRKVDTEQANASGQAKQYHYNACVNLAKSNLRSECEETYGNYDSDTGSCQKPTATRPMSEFTSEFEAYKATLPATDYAGRGATSMTNEVERILCRNWGGVWYDNWGPNNTCIKYN